MDFCFKPQPKRLTCRPDAILVTPKKIRNLKTSSQNQQNHPNDQGPENLPWQRRTTHLVEIKYCEDTGPEQQLQAAHAQQGRLRRSIAGDHVLHVILLGVGGVIYIPHTLAPLKSLGLDLQRVKKLALKLHAHYVHHAHKLVQTRRPLEHSPHLQTNEERSAGLSARNPPDPH